MILRIAKWLAIYVVAAAAAALALYAMLYPYHPTTMKGWAWFCLLALPIIIIGFAAQQAFVHNPIAERIEARTEGTSISGLRMLYAFVVLVVVSTIALLVMHLFGLF